MTVATVLLYWLVLWVTGYTCAGACAGTGVAGVLCMLHTDMYICNVSVCTLQDF